MILPPNGDISGIYDQIYLKNLSRKSGELRTRKFKSSLLRTQNLKVLSLKPGVVEYIAIHAKVTSRDFTVLISTLLAHISAFFPKPLPRFSYVSCGEHWFLCRPVE